MDTIMEISDKVGFVQKVLDFIEVEHRDIAVINFIILSAITIYIFRKIYILSTKCEGIKCQRLVVAVSKVESIDKKIDKLENLVIELKSESKSSHAQLRRDLDRFDRYLEDLQRNTYELHGILSGSSTNSKDKSRKRIIHDN